MYSPEDLTKETIRKKEILEASIKKVQKYLEGEPVSDDELRFAFERVTGTYTSGYKFSNNKLSKEEYGDLQNRETDFRERNSRYPNNYKGFLGPDRQVVLAILRYRNSKYGAETE